VATLGQQLFFKPRLEKTRLAGLREESLVTMTIWAKFGFRQDPD